MEIGTRREYILLRMTRPEVEALRKIALTNALVCPECETPVRVKAGEIKVWHFAHSVRKNCPLQNESATLLQARAFLYSWLETKFPGGVTIEAKPEGTQLPRPIDCVVTTDNGATIAFWIFEKSIRNPDIRSAIRAGVQKVGTARWTLISGMLQQSPLNPAQIALSTTERELITATPYDVIYSDIRTEGSLHYLNAETEQLITLRALHKLHGEHGYKSHVLTDPLHSVLITAKGEFVHPGEFERRQRRNEQRKEIRKAVHEEADYWTAKREVAALPQTASLDNTAAVTSPPSLLDMLFLCTKCGQTVGFRDVSQADYGHQTCLCRSCVGLITQPHQNR